MATIAHLWSVWMLVLMVTLYCQAENIYRRFDDWRRGDSSAYGPGLVLFFFFVSVCVICILLLVASAVWALAGGK